MNEDTTEINTCKEPTNETQQNDQPDFADQLWIRQIIAEFGKSDQGFS